MFEIFVNFKDQSVFSSHFRKQRTMHRHSLLYIRFVNIFQAETDDMYKKIGEYEAQTKEYNNISDKLDADLRDVGKKVQKFETKMEETLEKLQASSAKVCVANELDILGDPTLHRDGFSDSIFG